MSAFLGDVDKFLLIVINPHERVRSDRFDVNDLGRRPTPIQSLTDC